MANIRNYAVHTVPEHVLALVLALRRNLLAYRQEIEQGAWQKSEQFCLFTHHIRELYGSTMGIIGEGAIGQGTAAIAKASACTYCLHTIHRQKRRMWFLPHWIRSCESDILSLHCPLTPATRNIIGIDELRKMKRGALLINTARGGLVNEAALVQALDEGLIAGAGFDVLTTEPPVQGSPLLDLRRPNFIFDSTRGLGFGRGDAGSCRSVDEEYRSLGGGQAPEPGYVSGYVNFGQSFEEGHPSTNTRFSCFL